ncbi:MAG: lysozyme inhibitor LprI family protein [Terrimicrobiaceae bacterium]
MDCDSWAMGILRVPLIALFLLTAPAFVRAQSQQEMNRQAEAEAEVADKELNEAYKKLMVELDDEGKALLKTSQRAWLVYRDAEAAFAADAMRDGSAAPLLYSGSIAALTKARTLGLRERLEANAADVEEPEGADTLKKAGEIFFKAYARHDRAAAARVASEAALAELNWDAKSGSPEGLQLMDPTHIYYVGGSIEMKIKKNTQGRWLVTSLAMTAD